LNKTDNDIQFTNKCINTIRLLSVDAVQKANSGHPGMPMDAAPMAHTLWTNFLRYNPADPDWNNRDRFILSAGHGCMLLYSLLYLTGYGLTLDDIKNFRQLDSLTPGHPESGLTKGVEVTTGPLGQGFANGVGFGIARKYLAARYNKPGFEIFNYKIYVICSDGDLMEGISYEAASVAGHLKLSDLIYLYDDNHISIEGSTEIAFTEDTKKRFEALGWNVLVVDDGNDTNAIHGALSLAQNEKEKPTLIKIRTHIGYGSPNKVDTAGAHGSPLGDEEVKLTKKALGWDPELKFNVPEDVLEYYRSFIKKGSALQNDWNTLFEKYKNQYPDLAKELSQTPPFNKGGQGGFPPLPVFQTSESIATRTASGKVLNALAPHFPNLIGGSADLEPSTDTFLKGLGDFQPDNYAGRNLHFGVREHSMAAILNGIAHTQNLIPYGATFLIFSDYMKPSIRLACIMGIRPIYVFTHDSIGLGEDGTTHQPVEQLLAMRAIPGMTVIRPADANETAQAWKAAILHSEGPVALVLTRQKLPVLPASDELSKGAYTISDCEEAPQIIIIATGSEVSISIEAQKLLKSENINARVISMPCCEFFDKQSDEYKNKILPDNIPRLIVEAASPLAWYKYIGKAGGNIIAMNTFGKSAPADDLFKEFGFTPENIAAKAKELIKH
jgi:transketolase